MKILNIASGSSGNATYIGSEDANILIDAGVSRKRIAQGLEEAGIRITDLDAVLVTHEHIDHVSGIGVLERSHQIPVYTTEGTIRGMNDIRSLGEFDRDVFIPIKAGRGFSIGSLDIMPLRISHDANEPVCYRISEGEKSFAVVTDLGEYDDELLSYLQGLTGILLESNHDVRMLEAGPYPYPLKRRILGRFGHLSNESSGRLLARVLHDNIKYIALGHFDIHVTFRDRPSPAVVL